MAWIYFPELAGFHSLSPPGFEQSPIVKSTDTARASYCLECDQVTLAALPSGTMCELSKRNCSRKSISSPEASLVRTSVLLELEQAWEEQGRDSFSRSSDSLANFDPDSFSWRTSQLSLFGGLTAFSWSSLRSGTIVDGRLYQPQSLEPRISENDGSSLLPTPSASTYGSNQGGAAGRTGKVRHSLETMARKDLWPTPRASDAAKEAARGHGVDLTSAVVFEGVTGGQLNPMWVEWLMGYPPEWTALEVWAMQWFRLKRAKPSDGSLA